MENRQELGHIGIFPVGIEKLLPVENIMLPEEVSLADRAQKELGARDVGDFKKLGGPEHGFSGLALIGVADVIVGGRFIANGLRIR